MNRRYPVRALLESERPETITAKYLCEKLGISDRSAQRQMRIAVEEGWLKCIAETKYVKGISGSGEKFYALVHRDPSEPTSTSSRASRASWPLAKQALSSRTDLELFWHHNQAPSDSPS